MRLAAKVQAEPQADGDAEILFESGTMTQEYQGHSNSVQKALHGSGGPLSRTRFPRDITPENGAK